MNDTFIHPSAIVDDMAKIGRGTRIWHFCHVMPEAVIGRDCVLGQNVMIARRARVGDGCKIQNNVSVYEGVTLEDDVFCGPGCVFTNVINPRAFVFRKDEFRPTLVRRGASVGANATIVCGVTMGMYCFVGAGAVVTKNVRNYALITGVPGRQKAWISRHGHVLKFDKTAKAQCPESGLEYLIENYGGEEPVSGVGAVQNEGYCRCLDVDEMQNLNNELSIGKVDYQEMRKRKIWFS